ncbi:MAG: DUF6477 family protein [Pseudomonadota bacterium]
MSSIDVSTLAPSVLLRPRLLANTAKRAARLYRRERDLPGAVAGLLAKPEPQILRRLAEAERVLEDQRRQKSPAYRVGRHVQTLAALLAESAAIGDPAEEPPQPIMSGSSALRLST